MNPIDDDEMLLAAYHEAGHAVVAVALRLPIESVTIRRSLEEYGHVQYGQRFVASLQWRSDNRRSCDYAVQAAAGTTAEMLVRRNRRPTWDELRAESHDWTVICNAALATMDEEEPDHGPFFTRILDRAERILRKRLNAVDDLARALLDHPTLTLTGAEVRSIVKASTRPAQSTDRRPSSSACRIKSRTR